ncbi:MAG: YgjV family protein [Candidatus Delongbacteria bacterium]
MNLADTPPIAMLLGLTGVALNLLWPLLRGRRKMLVLQALSGLCFLLHYALIEAWTGSLMNGLATLQALAAIPLGTRPGFRVAYLLTLPAIALGLALTWMGWPSVFASLGMAGISLGRYQTRVLPFRLILLLTIPFWTGHNLLVGSLPGLLSDALVSVSSLVGLWILVRERRAAAAA